MLRYSLKRLLSLLISLAVASVVIFLVIEVAPGDPAAIMLGINAQPDTLASLRAELGLDVPKWQRYLNWVGGMVQGDFGTSYTYRTPVADMIAARMQVSLPLALYALTLSTLIAFPAGILAASRRNSAADLSVMGATQLGVAIPNFWFAMILVLVFAMRNLQRVSGHAADSASRTAETSASSAIPEPRSGGPGQPASGSSTPSNRRVPE